MDEREEITGWERRAVELRGRGWRLQGDWVGDVMGLNRVPRKSSP